MNDKLERLVRLLPPYIKGRIWCLTFHAPVIREIGGYGGRDHLNRRRKAYHGMLCVKCGNRWDQADNGERCIGSHVWHWRQSERGANAESEVISTALLCDLQLLIGNWENEHKFLSGENDSQYDKGAGSAFGICAGLLKEIIKTHNAEHEGQA